MSEQFYNTVNYKGRDMKYACLDFEPNLDESITKWVMWNIADMYSCGNERRTLSKKNFKARIRNVGSHSIGMLRGEVFNATVETDDGESRLAIILTDFIDKRSLN
ncbi:hypothetical protein HYT24_03015 [Candidatus Pacearchaeota archaeon]|nr:hypothetical protein [Candidatus Pacearchaeota archaeon]